MKVKYSLFFVFLIELKDYMLLKTFLTIIDQTVLTVILNINNLNVLLKDILSGWSKTRHKHIIYKKPTKYKDI